MKQKRTMFSFWIFSDLLEKVRKVAIKKRIPVSQIINKSLSEHLDKKDV